LTIVSIWTPEGEPVMNFEVEPKVGTSRTKLALKRCGRSKSETARRLPRSKASPCAVKAAEGRL
jgi:hypothetical protein